jgi:alanine-glyoxylate transaminase/serine-glyoxylate transaminase/serine-pyruvate transaminase
MGFGRRGHRHRFTLPQEIELPLFLGLTPERNFTILPDCPTNPDSSDEAAMPAINGRHFLQIPGPTNVPDRVLRAIDSATIDHRGPAFQKLGQEVLAGLKHVFKTRAPVVIFPASGTGAWEAALVNTLSSGDRILMCETGHFATLWHSMSKKLGLVPEFIAGDWRHGADPAAIEKRLIADTQHEIKAVCVVHNETSTGVTSRIGEVRKAIDRARHPALFMVDTISSLASIDYRHDEWGVDVTVAGSQKGLMLPPGLSFNAISDKALAASKAARLPRSYWDWDDMLTSNKTGFFPYTPATNLLYGLRESLNMLLEEGLDNVFKRHDRHAEATRRAVRAWGLEILCLNPAEYSSSLTAVLMPEGHNEADFRKVVLDHFNMSLGQGLSKVAGKVFRIGHLGDFNDLMLAGTLAGVEMGLALAGVPHQKGGVAAAMEYLTSAASAQKQKPAARLGVA